MSNIWWKNLLSDNDANNINNYATTEGGTTVPGGTLADHTIFFSNTASSAKWQLSANLTIGSGPYTLVVNTGGTDNYTGDGNTTGNINLNGKELTTLSSSIGGTDTANKVYFRMPTGSKLKWTGDFIVSNNFVALVYSGYATCSFEYSGTTGSFQIMATISIVSSNVTLFNKGILKFDNDSFNNRPYLYEDLAASTVEGINGTINFCSNTIKLRGTLIIGAAFTLTGAVQNWYFYDGCDITGSGILANSASSFVTFYNEKTIPFTFNNYLIVYASTTANRYIFCGNFKNADCRINNTVGDNCNIYGFANTLICKKFSGRTISYSTNVYLDGLTLEVWDDCYLKTEVGTGVITIIKGTSTIRLAGLNKNFYGNLQSIHTLNILSGASYTDKEGFASDDIINNGTFILDSTKSYNVQNPSGAGAYASVDSETVYVQYTGDYTFTGTLDKVVFVRDGEISFNQQKKLIGIGITL